MKDLETAGKLLFEGGCGLGSLSAFLCQRIVAEGGTGRLVAVDSDPDDLAFAERRLTDSGLAVYARFVYDDLERLECIGEGSVDHAFLAGTVSWFESIPLRTVSVLARLRLALKPEGILSVMDQAPAACQCGVWSRVWEVQKLLRRLQGRAHLVEIPVERLVGCLETMGFVDVEYALFDGEKVTGARTAEFIARLRGQAEQLTNREAAHVVVGELDDLEVQLSETDVSPKTYVIHCRRAKN